MLFKDIILLTHDFPFFTGYPTAEAYLESEIAVLARNAERVVVIAHEGYDPTWTLRMNLPENVQAFGIVDLALLPQTPEDMKAEMQTYLRPPCPEVRSDLRKLGTSRPKWKAALDFLHLSDAKLRGFKKVIDDNGLQFDGASTLIYSFWFNEPARDAVLLADMIEERSGTRPVCISRAHGYDCYDYRSDVNYLPFKTWMAKRLDGVFPCSDDGRRHLAANNPKVADRFHTAHLGTVDHGLGPWSMPDQTRTFTLACCSRAVPLKRVDRVLTTLKLLEERGRACRFIFIGTGETMPILEELSQNLQTTEVVFKGSLPNEEVIRFYEETPVDVFVNVSEVEGLPISIMEVISFGIPVIATDVGGEQEIVQEGMGSLIPKDFSDTQLANVLEAYMDAAEEERRSMRAKARAVWEAGFSVERNVEALLERVARR